MAQLDEVFYPDEVADSQFEPVPKGEYLVQVSESDYVDNKNRTGKNMKLTLEILDGELKNRKIFLNLSYVNPNAQAQEIARRALKYITTALGIENLQDTTELHFRPFIAKITVSTDKSGQYSDSNNIGGAKPAGGAAGARQSQSSRPAQQSRPSQQPASRPSANSAGGRPWGGRAGQQQPRNDILDDAIPF